MLAPDAVSAVSPSKSFKLRYATPPETYGVTTGEIISTFASSAAPQNAHPSCSKPRPGGSAEGARCLDRMNARKDLASRPSRSDGHERTREIYGGQEGGAEAHGSGVVTSGFGVVQ